LQQVFALLVSLLKQLGFSFTGASAASSSSVTCSLLRISAEIFALFSAVICQTSQTLHFPFRKCAAGELNTLREAGSCSSCTAFLY